MIGIPSDDSINHIDQTHVKLIKHIHQTTTKVEWMKSIRHMCQATTKVEPNKLIEHMCQTMTRIHMIKWIKHASSNNKSGKPIKSSEDMCEANAKMEVTFYNLLLSDMN
jgi:hypothetical protein